MLHLIETIFEYPNFIECLKLYIVLLLILLIFDQKYCLEIFTDIIMRKNLTEILNKKNEF